MFRREALHDLGRAVSQDSSHWWSTSDPPQELLGASRSVRPHLERASRHQTRSTFRPCALARLGRPEALDSTEGSVTFRARVNIYDEKCPCGATGRILRGTVTSAAWWGG